MQFDTRSRRRGLNLALGLLVGFSTSVGIASEPLTFYGFDKESHSAAAHEGMEEIFSGRCFHGGVPIKAARIAATARANPKSAQKEDPDSHQEQSSDGRNIPSPPNRFSGKLPGLPLGASVFQRNGVMLVNGNCFGCHAGIVNGQVVAGLGNTRTDQSVEFQGTKGLLENHETLAASLTKDAERKEFGEFVANTAAAVTPFQFAKTRGDNFGPYAVWRLGARLADPVSKGMLVSEEPTELDKLFLSVELPTVDPMAWWLLKYKTKDYWYADAGPQDASHFAFNFTTAHPEINESRADHVKTVAKALAFARATHSPPFPKSLDAELVQKGADLFHGRTSPTESKGFVACKTCHGTYTRKASQSDLTKPGSWTVTYDFSTALRNVKTDNAYNTTLKKLQPIADHINTLKVYFAARQTPELAPYVSTPAKEGYVAPPLVGVWASAPYFHNGSVPTIAAVLDSKQRPEIWSRNNDPHAYNLEQIGMDFEPVSPAEFSQSAAAVADADYRSKSAVDHRSIYDTRGFGRGNSGHTFGDRLTAAERSAVIEFLKSLSGPDM